VSAAGLDPRLTPARRDLAAAKLRGLVTAPRYAEGRRMCVVVELADLRRAPAPDAAVDTQALHGEIVTVYDDQEGWAWVQLENDGYVDYIDATALGALTTAPTHRVTVSRTHVYPRPDIKAPPLGALPLGATLAVVGTQDGFARTVGSGFVFARHLAAIDSFATDFVGVAEAFLGTAYLWGGKSALGIDCSGLVQLALREAGVAAPRDTDMQARVLGAEQPIDADLDHVMRGDLVFWRGHVGIMRDARELLHANAFHMRVASEPLAVARARIGQSAGGDLLSIRRLNR